MKVSHLNVGLIHSLIGKNDGVSIVVDQTVNAMIKDMDVELGNIHFLAAHTSPRFNAETDDVFWHKNEIHKEILKEYSTDPAPDLEDRILFHAEYAKKRIKRWIKEKSIDLIIAHNTSHVYNFVTAVALGLLFEELKEKNIIWPKLMVWWHDSYFERETFAKPNHIIKKYLKYLPGTNIDGIAFINHSQPDLGKKYFNQYVDHAKSELFFRERSIVVPNTSDIPWDWKNNDWEGEKHVFPEQDNYNDSFFNDIGLKSQIEEIGYTIDDTVILLQHTRVVPRKKIETAIDFAFMLEDKYKQEGKDNCFAVLVSGHSGDEQCAYKDFLYDYHKQKLNENPNSKVILNFGEEYILSHRDIIVDKKYYKFAEIPSIVAAQGGIGTYFSEVEGYGNNLLEMICLGLPVFINKYEIYKSDIEHLEFKLPGVENCELNEELVESAYLILNDLEYRNQIVKHNLTTLEEKLDHRIIAEKIEPLINKMFTQILK